MVPAHDCAATIEETLVSVLRSGVDPGEAQIEVVDDCSRDIDLERLVSEVGDGRIGYVRHDLALGAPQTFNSCIARARGRWIHLLHADDVVLHGFYDRLGAAIDAYPSACAALCRSQYVDEAGRRCGMSPLERPTVGLLTDFLPKLAVTNRIRAPAIVVQRRTYERVGGFRPDLGHAADWEMWIRVAAHDAVVYEPTPLACYRLHAASDTNRLRHQGRDVADASRAVRAAQELPVALEPALEAAALDRLGRGAVESAQTFLRAGALDAAFAQLQEGVACIQSLTGLRAAVGLLGEVSRAAARSEAPSLLEPRRAAWRAARRNVAELLLDTPSQELERAYLGPFRWIRREFERAAIALEPLSEEEQRFIARLDPLIREEPASPALAARVFARALYRSGSPPTGNDTSDRRRRARCSRGRLRAASILGAAWTVVVAARLRLQLRARPVVALAVGAFHPRTRGDGQHVRWIAAALRDRGYALVVVAPRALGQAFLVDGLPVVPEARIVSSSDVVVTYGVSDTTRACSDHLAASPPRWIHHPCGMTGGGLAQRADRILALSSRDEQVARAFRPRNDGVTRLRAAAQPDRLGRPGGFRRRAAFDGEYILWAGAWLSAKGPRQLSERFVLLCNRHPELRLHLVMLGGYGSREFPIEHPRILPLDGSPDDVLDALADCLFVAFNSPPAPVGYDATPLFLLEALMNGRTFVAQSGTPLLDEVGDLGIVVRTDSEWLDAAESLIFDPARRQALERTCLAASRRRHDFARMMDGVDSMLQEVLEASHLPPEKT